MWVKRNVHGTIKERLEVLLATLKLRRGQGRTEPYKGHASYRLVKMSKCPNVELLYGDVEMSRCRNVQMLSYYIEMSSFGCRNVEMSKCRDVEMSRCRKRSRIHYFPIPHNALCLPPKFCINYCCGMLLGICRPPKSISQQ